MYNFVFYTTWFTYTFFDTGSLTVYYLPDGYTENAVQNAIERGHVHESDETWNSFERINGTAQKPVITTQPVNKTVNEGSTATFKVVATNADTYQWYYRKTSTSAWTAVSNNGTSATYTLTTAARHNGYEYYCLVSNSVGAEKSDTVKLTVKLKPTITTQPVNKTVNEGSKLFRRDPDREITEHAHTKQRRPLGRRFCVIVDGFQSAGAVLIFFIHLRLRRRK